MNTDSLKEKIWAETILFEEIDNFFIDSGDKSKVIIQLLEVALSEKNGSAIEYLLYAAQRNSVSITYESVFCKLLGVREKWMYKHEDVATLLGEIRSDSSVEYLYRLAKDYETSDTHDIPLKAIWALHDIGTAHALECLKILSQSDDVKKAKIATQMVNHFDEQSR
jgi:hypothetical protein